jgi:CheY-like chemotaxis protein
MEAVGTLAGGIAHDFNNLLQSIQSCAELLTLGARGNAAAELFDTILDAVRQGRDLGERLMTFSRRVEPEKMPVDVRRVVDAVWRLAGRTFPKTIRLERADPQGLPPVRANASQIEQVLMNLAINARDAMATGGTLRLETGVVTLPERDARADGPGDEGRDPDGPGAPDGRRPADPLADLAPGRYVFLRVADTGPGIDPAIRDRIFEPFFTTKEAGKGTGLGLAVVYGIVDAHEGRVVLESEPGRGTTFTVYFPALPEAEVGGGATAPDGERDRAPRRGQETILVVDDDPSVRNLARLMLSELGYTVVTAADAPEALVAFDGAGHGIDLVLLDLVLPGMNGWQCLEQLRRRDPTVKVLVASGYGPEAPGGGATEIGGFLKKPYAIGDLSRRLRAILDGQAEA